MISAGRVLIIPKGEWNDTDTYSKLDLVSYNGSSYIAKTSVPANTLPTNTSYWQLSAYGGSAANLAGNFAPLEITDYASQGYAVGDFLVNKDNQFCKVTSIITIGDELILKPNDNYNIEADNVGEEINALHSANQTLTNQVKDMNNVYGSKNLLPNNATSQTLKGVTFTVNSDGSVTANGTATDWATITNVAVITLKKGSYKNTYIGDDFYLFARSGGTASTNPLVFDYRQQGEFTLSQDTTLYVGMVAKAGATINNITLYPMIRLASITDDTYVPYAMTNRELTDNVTPISDVLTRGTDVGAGGANYATKVGKLVTFCFVGHTESERAKNSVLATLPYLPKDGMQIIAFNVSTSSAINLSIGTDGKLKNPNHIIANDNYFVVNGAYVTS